MLPVSCIPRHLACVLYTWIFVQYGVNVVHCRYRKQYSSAVIPKTQGTSKCVCVGIFLTELSCVTTFSRCFTLLVCYTHDSTCIYMLMYSAFVCICVHICFFSLLSASLSLSLSLTHTHTQHTHTHTHTDPTLSRSYI